MHKILLRTKVPINPIFPKINYENKVFSIGSCFSVEMATRLKKWQYQINQNPSGITFNPISIANTIKSIISVDSLPKGSLNCVNGVWSHPDFHGSFNSIVKDEVNENIQNSLAQAKSYLKDTEFVIITIGTAFVFEQKEDGRIVNNCHKRNASLFERKLLSSDQILKALLSVKSDLDGYCNTKPTYIITLSPVRHVRDGLAANQISKANCLIAINQFVEQYESCHYFPSYEIMLDDLRDYRFYKDDLIHPNTLALSYIFQKFEAFALNTEESNLRQKIDRITASLEHRPINPNSEAHLKFVTQLNKDIDALKDTYAWMFKP